MLSSAKNHKNLAGKLFLSSALVAVSLAYGWWQRHAATAPATVMAPLPVPPKPKTVVPAHDESVKSVPVPVTPAAPATPDTRVAANATSDTKRAHAAPRSTMVAMVAPATNKPAAEPAPPAQANEAPPPSASSAALSPQAALAMDLPTDEASPPLPLVTGMPSSALAPSIPAGTHLLDGDYVSDKHQFEWGDLVVKISIHGGQITGVQILRYPDHRSQSLYLSQMAGPILESELIKSQQSQVDIVSSATDTSYAFQDSIAGAILKATRG